MRHLTGWAFLSAPLSVFLDLSFKMDYILPAAISFNNCNYSLPLF